MRTIETNIYIQNTYCSFLDHFHTSFLNIFVSSFIIFFSGLHTGIYRTRIAGLYTLTKEKHNALSLINRVCD